MAITDKTQRVALIQELACAQEAAEVASAILVEGWGTRPEVRFKTSAIDLVTEFDGRSERSIIAKIKAAFPNDSIVGEEGGGHAGTSGRSWYIDPLDGTTNFSHGLPIFCVSIGLIEAGQPILGVVKAPVLGWTFSAVKGSGALLNQRSIQPSRMSSLAKALLVTGFPYTATNPRDNIPEFAAFMRASQGVRRLGSAALDLCFVACGWLDGYWEEHIKPWDLAAGAVILTEAGGKITAPDGTPFVAESGSALASNGLIHQAMLDELTRLRQTASSER